MDAYPDELAKMPKPLYCLIGGDDFQNQILEVMNETLLNRQSKGRSTSSATVSFNYISLALQDKIQFNKLFPNRKYIKNGVDTKPKEDRTSEGILKVK